MGEAGADGHGSADPRLGRQGCHGERSAAAKRLSVHCSGWMLAWQHCEMAYGRSSEMRADRPHSLHVQGRIDVAAALQAFLAVHPALPA